MNAHPILLQMKYARIIALFAKKMNLPTEEALRFFYHSETRRLMSEGVSDLHCMSDEYLSEDLMNEYHAKRPQE